MRIRTQTHTHTYTLRHIYIDKRISSRNECFIIVIHAVRNCQMKLTDVHSWFGVCLWAMKEKANVY